MEVLSTRKFCLLLPLLPKLPVSQMLGLPVGDPLALAAAYQDLLVSVADAAQDNIYAKMSAISTATEVEIKSAVKDDSVMADLVARAEERPFNEVLTEAVEVFTLAGMLLGLPPSYFGVTTTEDPAKQKNTKRISKA